MVPTSNQINPCNARCDDGLVSRGRVPRLIPSDPARIPPANSPEAQFEALPETLPETLPEERSLLGATRSV